MGVYSKYVLTRGWIGMRGLIAGLILVVGAAAGVPLVSKEKAADAFPFDGAFFAQLSRTPPILRDSLLDEKRNAVIIGRGLIRSIEKRERYHKRFCVVASDPETERYGIAVRYFIFVDKKESIALLKEGVTLEFTGQLMAYTPLTAYRSSYVFDILLEKGAILVE